MREMTPAELTRVVERLEGDHKLLVTKAVYDRDMAELRTDIREIKESLKWATRFMAALFVTVILQLAFIVIDNLPPP